MDKGKADHRFQARPLAAIAKRVFTKSRQRLAGVCFLAALHSLRGYPHTSPRNFPYTTDLPPRRAVLPRRGGERLFLRIAARQAGKVGEVFLVHAENIVRTGIVRRRDETGAAGREGDALLREHTLGGRVHIVSDLFRGRCDRVHGDRLLASGFADERFHDKLRHGGAADGVAFFYLILGRKKQETFFQISCSVCRCVSGGYFVVKVRGKLTRCEADKLEIVTLRFHSLSL